MEATDKDRAGKVLGEWAGCVLGCVVLMAIVAAVLFPVFARAREAARNCACQQNLKGIATSLYLYKQDYNGMLPSSALRRPGSKDWDAKASAEFCAEMGPVPSPKNPAPADIGWIQVLWPYMRYKDSMWCYSDGANGSWHRPDSHTLVSYIYKPAVDRAWFGASYPKGPAKPGKDLVVKCFRKYSDFAMSADQIVFFEKKGWHWGDQNKGWSDGVTINAAFLDGHARNVRLRSSVNQPVPEDAAELAKLLAMPGEPMWFNGSADAHGATGKTKPVKAQFHDPRVNYDDLQ